MNNIIVLIPTYNEIENAEKIIKAVLLELPQANILIIDDNSPDGTGDLADKMAKEDERIKVLHREKKQGLGKAYVDGFKWALENDYQLVVQMDADFSHDPKYLKDMIVLSKKNDLVIGSRYSHGVSCYNWPISRILLSKFANVYVELFTRLPVKDATGGFKCYNSKVLKNMNLDKIRSNGYSFQIETNFKTYILGYKIVELPIIFYERTEGRSKISRRIVFEALFLVQKLFLGRIFGIYRKSKSAN